MSIQGRLAGPSRLPAPASGPGLLYRFKFIPEEPNFYHFKWFRSSNCIGQKLKDKI